MNKTPRSANLFSNLTTLYSRKDASTQGLLEQGFGSGCLGHIRIRIYKNVGSCSALIKVGFGFGKKSRIRIRIWEKVGSGSFFF